MRHPIERDYVANARSTPSWDQQILRLQQRQRIQGIITMFIAAMGIAGWGLLLLFLWVATP